MADLISILIPTRNRPALAQLCVDTALANSDDDCEIVVADNNDLPLDLPVHPRLRVLAPQARPLSMPDNWERSLDAARGEWVMLLADKYMLAPGGVRALREQMGHGPLLSYVYGILRQGLGATLASDQAALITAGGTLSWSAPDSPRQIASQDALAGLLASVGAYPAWAPMLYTALAQRSLVERARGISGRFFFGPCPDVASALQLLARTESYWSTRLPVVMAQYPSESFEWSNGASAQVGGAAGRAFLDQLAERWDPLLGKLQSVLMLWTVLEARRLGVLADALAPDWRFVAAQASREIETLPLSRVRLHGKLTAELLAHDAPFGALWSQLRAALGVHAPELAKRLYLRLRTEPASREAGPKAAAVEQAVVRDREEALDRLERILLVPMAAHAHTTSVP